MFGGAVLTRYNARELAGAVCDSSLERARLNGTDPPPFHVPPSPEIRLGLRCAAAAHLNACVFWPALTDAISDSTFAFATWKAHALETRDTWLPKARRLSQLLLRCSQPASSHSNTHARAPSIHSYVSRRCLAGEIDWGAAGGEFCDMRASTQKFCFPSLVSSAMITVCSRSGHL